MGSGYMDTAAVEDGVSGPGRDGLRGTWRQSPAEVVFLLDSSQVVRVFLLDLLRFDSANLFSIMVSDAPGA
jgi:hypothetical protein